MYMYVVSQMMSDDGGNTYGPCPICKEQVMDDPTTLQCGHSYCEECIVKCLGDYGMTATTGAQNVVQELAMTSRQRWCHYFCVRTATDCD